MQRPESFVICLCVRTRLPESLFNLTEIISVQSIHSLAARFEGKQIPHVLFMRAIYLKHTEGIYTYTSMGCCKALGCIKQLQRKLAWICGGQSGFWSGVASEWSITPQESENVLAQQNKDRHVGMNTRCVTKHELRVLFEHMTSHLQSQRQPVSQLLIKHLCRHYHVNVPEIFLQPRLSFVEIWSACCRSDA